jgi:hypothetical protein
MSSNLVKFRQKFISPLFGGFGKPKNATNCLPGAYAPEAYTGVDWARSLDPPRPCRIEEAYKAD